ncbi:divisome protein SepX/GlpR [Nocardiopsis nanhaiensis]
MSSSPLYLAIVVVWLIVLVPMLLRKDSVDTVHEDTRREDEDAGAPEAEEEAEHGAEGLSGGEEDPGLNETQVITRPGGRGDDPDVDEAPVQVGRPAERRGPPAREPRARVIARRRRRTSALTLLNIATIAAVSIGLGPWWVIAPPVLLLAGHLALLREAAKADAERREAYFRARRQAALRARRAEEEEAREAEREAEREAQVIAFIERRSQVYDQYADARLRAAGD